MSRTFTGLVAAAVLVSGGCVASADTAPAVLTLSYVATDYSFDGPATAPSGLTEFRMINQGGELHHIALIRLEEGRTMLDLFAAMQEGATTFPSWAREVGGPSAAGPGGEIASTVLLEPGRYAVLCFIPSPHDGIPHVMKGMAMELDVTEGMAQAPAPEPAIELVLTDYDFEFSQPLRAGTNHIRVRTATPHRQAHEAVFVRLEDGRSVEDMAHWVEAPDGPPPGMPIGGVAGLSPGEWNDLTLELEPGRYGILCFLPDVGDGMPHIVHGMLTEITVE
jgi:hypothetical protein